MSTKLANQSIGVSELEEEDTSLRVIRFRLVRLIDWLADRDPKETSREVSAATTDTDDSIHRS